MKIQATLHWKGILELARYFAEHPDSRVFPREVPVAVDTKFLENTYSLVLDLVRLLRLDIPSFCDTRLPWEQRLGLRRKTDMIHIRLPLQGMLTVMETPCVQLDHIIIPKEAFVSFQYPSLQRVFIVENETLFLTFPIQAGELAIYRGGFAISALAGASWLNECALSYFSDIDEHGFAMLDMMRGMYPQTQSFCMDEQTFNHFTEYHVSGKNYPGKFDRLTGPETALLKRLKADISTGRLEQEHIDLGYIERRKSEL